MTRSGPPTAFWAGCVSRRANRVSTICKRNETEPPVRLMHPRPNCEVPLEAGMPVPLPRCRAAPQRNIRGLNIIVLGGESGKCLGYILNLSLNTTIVRAQYESCYSKMDNRPPTEAITNTG
jgi:hypothetical protein